MVKERAEVPVVTLYYERLRALVGRRKTIQQILENLPYIGLDIEEQGSDYVRVEYNPNRPDFSTDYGIARALRGMMGIETGLPGFKCGRSRVRIMVDPSVNKVRPYIVSLVALGGSLDSEGVRQIITMQEDLHEGIGRKRKKVSVGIHNYDVIKPPLTYTTEGPDFRFVPLNSDKSMSIQEILEQTDAGRQYSSILEGQKRFPVIKDSDGNVLSFPPIINSELTRVTERIKNLLIDVTAIDLRAAEDTLAIIAFTLADASFRIESVKLSYKGKNLETPRTNPATWKIDKEYVNRLLGLKLSTGQIIQCLKRSRLGGAAGGNKVVCKIPRYRLDIMHGVDLLEDIAIGYGIHRMKPSIPSAASAGSKEPVLKILDSVREVLAGLGMLEVMNFNLVSRKTQYEMSGRPESNVLAVEQTKSIEHEVLRDSIIPSLMQTLSRNIHEPYPQMIFEVGKTFEPGGGVREYWTVAAAIAHKESNYTEAKSYLQALLKNLLRLETETPAASDAMLAEGRAAEVIAKKRRIGVIGEVDQRVTDSFKLRVPVSVFEVNLSGLLEG